MIIRRNTRHSDLAYERERRAFTLVELLVVIAIIVTLASMSLLALSGVLADAKAARTKSQITRINSLLMAKWDTYTSRPAPVQLNVAASDLNNAGAIAGVRRQRLLAIRELQRLEFPDRISDVFEPGTTNSPSMNLVGRTPNPYPALHNAYRRRNANAASLSGMTWTAQYQGAECLYMILAEMSDGGKSALDFFSEGEIGDVDNDGMKEILDAWGNPIEFIRWAPGLSNQATFVGSNLSDIQFGSPVETPDGRAGSPDPLDPFRVGGNANFALFPFVYSAGRDKAYGIAADRRPDSSGTTFEPIAADFNPSPPVPITDRFNYSTFASNPYYQFPTAGADWQFGKFVMDGDQSFEDTIHNHQLSP